MPEVEVELKTAPVDFRLPTTNQTRHCFTCYIEFHRCLAAKGEESGACEKFAGDYRSLCLGDWVERWNEQRETGKPGLSLGLFDVTPCLGQSFCNLIALFISLKLFTMSFI